MPNGQGLTEPRRVQLPFVPSRGTFGPMSEAELARQREIGNRLVQRGVLTADDLNRMLTQYQKSGALARTNVRRTPVQKAGVTRREQPEQLGVQPTKKPALGRGQAGGIPQPGGRKQASKALTTGGRELYGGVLSVGGRPGLPRMARPGQDPRRDVFGGRRYGSARSARSLYRQRARQNLLLSRGML